MINLEGWIVYESVVYKGLGCSRVKTLMPRSWRLWWKFWLSLHLGEKKTNRKRINTLSVLSVLVAFQWSIITLTQFRKGLEGVRPGWSLSKRTFTCESKDYERTFTCGSKDYARKQRCMPHDASPTLIAHRKLSGKSCCIITEIEVHHWSCQSVLQQSYKAHQCLRASLHVSMGGYVHRCLNLKSTFLCLLQWILHWYQWNSQTGFRAYRSSVEVTLVL